MSNMKSSLTLVGVAILGGAFGSLATGWLRPTAVPPQPEGVADGRAPRSYFTRESMSTTRDSSGRLLQSLGSLSDRVEALEAMFDDEAVDPTADTPPVPTPETRAAARREAMAQLKVFDSSFRDEVRDPSWSDGMKRQIQGAFDSGDFKGTRMLSNECRSTSCRVEVSHDSEDSRLQFQLIRRQLAGSYFMQEVRAEDGSETRTVAYFVREGKERDSAIFRSSMRPGSDPNAL